jgi:hypothetical protein
MGQQDGKTAQLQLINLQPYIQNLTKCLPLVDQ